MVHYAFPVLSWDQVYADRDRALEQTPVAGEQPPTYSQATKGTAPVNVTEKELAEKQKRKGKSSEKWATLKGIMVKVITKDGIRVEEYNADEFPVSAP